MSRTLRFSFHPDVALEQVEQTLLLAKFATEGLLGRVRVELDSHTFLDRSLRSIFIYERSDVDWIVTRIFTALLLREFREDLFVIDVVILDAAASRPVMHAA